MESVCQVCSKKFENDETFHRHLRVHKLKQHEYYQKYFPRFDKYDGSQIRFDTVESYSYIDFNSRQNLSLWLKKVSKQEAQTYLTDWFRKRKLRKHLEYAPTQVELRGLPVPGMSYLNELFGSYYKFAGDLGFKLRFNQVGFSGAWKDFEKGHSIVVDTREQMPLVFKMQSQSEKLDFGDYKLNDAKFSHNCHIERKNTSDLYGTLLKGFPRFCKEIERAAEANAYLIILVEEPFRSIASFSTYLARMNRSVHISPAVIYHNIRRLYHKYPHIQFLFVENRSEATRAVELLFRSNGEFKKVDLQFAYDSRSFKLT